MNKRGFTLIELLAVIIILGILMIIAIPSVTQYINNSRKSAYVDTAKEIISGTRNLVNKGDLEMFDTNATYYIPIEAIGTENGQKSPYGDFEEAYVVVTYNGNNYTYYWLSVDETGQGVKNITRADKLDEDDIESDIKTSEITDKVTTVGIGNRTTIKVLDDSTNYKSWKTDITLTNTSNNIPEVGEGGSGGTTPTANKICKRATSLHNGTTCERTASYGCRGNAYAKGATITYGNETTTVGTLTAGDAFDCDVTSNGDWERFYYVSSEYNANTNSFDNTKAVLIYYANISNDGTTITAPVQTGTAYSTQEAANEVGTCNNSYGCNWYGPLVAYNQLPSITQWSNTQIIRPETRKVVTESSAHLNATSFDYGNTYAMTISDFNYANKAARFLTAQEVIAGCSSLTSVGTITEGELNGCNYLLESVGQYEGSSGAYGYWLETPRSDRPNSAWYLNGEYRTVSYYNLNDSNFYGVRPAITVALENIEY